MPGMKAWIDGAEAGRGVLSWAEARMQPDKPHAALTSHTNRLRARTRSAALGAPQVRDMHESDKEIRQVE